MQSRCLIFFFPEKKSPDLEFLDSSGILIEIFFGFCDYFLVWIFVCCFFSFFEFCCQKKKISVKKFLNLKFSENHQKSQPAPQTQQNIYFGDCNTNPQYQTSQLRLFLTPLGTKAKVSVHICFELWLIYQGTWKCFLRCTWIGSWVIKGFAMQFSEHRAPEEEFCSPFLYFLRLWARSRSVQLALESFTGIMANAAYSRCARARGRSDWWRDCAVEILVQRPVLKKADNSA